MIKINKTDNIFDIISKIKKLEKSEQKIILDFPFWHNVLYNKVALKSLKDSCSDKKIIISTTDILSKKIWKQIWLKYSIIKNSKFIEKEDLLKYNYSFLEYLIYEVKIFFNKILQIVFKNKKIIDPRKKFLKYYKQKSNLALFIILLIISISIFSYVFLFALNKTSVYITPDIQVKTKAKNFIFKENLKADIQNTNNINLKTFTKQVSLIHNINTSWVKQKERDRSTWTVLLINKFETEIKLLDKTRLESTKWIIYETTNWVKIPAAIKNKSWTLIPWTKEVKIIAQLRDKKWKVTGSRWNIEEKDIILILPWLDKKDRSNIFAKTTSEIKWGEDKFEQILWENDLKNAKIIFNESLKKEAIKQIQKEIESINNQNNIKYKILQVDNIYKFSNINIIMPDIEIWESIDSFKVEWSLNIKTYAFNIDSVISKLKKTVEENILVWKEKLLYINNKSLNIFPEKWILYRSENPLTIKATIEVEYNVEYNFLKENDNYISRLKQTISTMDKEEAEKRLINENKISNAVIEIRPFFVNKVSKYLNNIEFIVD